MPQKNSGQSYRLKGLKHQESMVEKVVVQGVNCLRIPLTKEKSTIIDVTDWDIVKNLNWYARKAPNTFYSVSKINAKTIYMHILIMKEKGIDHINGNGLDNRRINLRKATHSQNLANMSKYRNRVSSSKYKGVYFEKSKNIFRSYIQGKHLGCFKTEIEAANAYDDNAKELFGDFARLNNAKNEVKL